MPEERLSMRLDKVTKHDLVELVRRLALSQTAVVKLALRELAQRRKIKAYEPGGRTDADPG